MLFSMKKIFSLQNINIALVIVLVLNIIFKIADGTSTVL